jgi:hypothetical protein
MAGRTRLLACLTTAGLLSVTAVAAALEHRRPAALPSARATSAVVLGSRSFALNGAGFGTAHPSRIFNGGDPSGLVSHIHWAHWGASVATGRGLNSIFKPSGGYYSQLVTIELRASRLGHCTAGGPLAYRRLSFRAPSHPGGKLGPWTLWSGTPTICSSP